MLKISYRHIDIGFITEIFGNRYTEHFYATDTSSYVCSGKRVQILENMNLKKAGKSLKMASVEISETFEFFLEM